MSVPAAIRHRWRTREVLVDDRGDYFVVRPAPEDPIAAFRGSLKGSPASDATRRLAREEERRREERAKHGRRGERR